MTENMQASRAQSRQAVIMRFALNRENGGSTAALNVFVHQKPAAEPVLLLRFLIFNLLPAEYYKGCRNKNSGVYAHYRYSLIQVYAV